MVGSIYYDISDFIPINVIKLRELIRDKKWILEIGPIENTFIAYPRDSFISTSYKAYRLGFTEKLIFAPSCIEKINFFQSYQ